MIDVQMPLGIRLRDSATFDSFISGDNDEVLALLSNTLLQDDASCWYLWGETGTGKSHLLQALCHARAEKDLATAYLPLSDITAFDPAFLQGMETYPVVCVDDVQALAGHADWEEALFHLYNRVSECGGRLVVAANKVPAELGFKLADLRTRLLWGGVYQLKALSEDDKIAALIARSKIRGMVMSVEVGQYLLRHSARDMVSLLALLDRLDRASLAAQRRLTIPFVRQVLAAA